MTDGAAAHRPDIPLIVEVDGQRHEFAPAELPVAIGGDASADVGIEGVPGTVQIGQLGAVFFVQAGRNARNIRVGGERVAGSHELRDGDVIALDRARLACRIAGGRLTVTVEVLATAGDTAPPDLEGLARAPASRAADIAITPIAFKPFAIDAAVGRRRFGRATLGIAAACAAVAMLAWFIFTARSVALNFEPQAENIELPSTLLKLRIGDRFLLRPGEHRVTAELAGYYPLRTDIHVGAAPDQSIALEFTKLPGKVSVSTDPDAQADVLLDGVPLGRTPLTDVEIKPGTHELQLTAQRFVPQKVELEVRGGGERQTLVAKLTPSWAPVSVDSEPKGATVLVDGAEAGVTPAALEIEGGERALELRLPGYNAWLGKVQVNANQPLQLPTVKLAQADGRVEVVTDPAEANATIDGEFRGRTPLTVRLSPGRSHQLTLAKPGYETATRELSVTADSGRHLQIGLTAQYGEVDVRSHPPQAEIWVDGQKQGLTPSRLTLTAVNHDIEIRREGYSVGRAKITPRPGFPQVLDNELTALDRGSGTGFAPQLRTSIGQELKLVPAGQFTMGSSRREVGRRSNEVLRPVRLTKAYYLGTREVTNAEFRQFKPEHDSGEFGGQSLNGDDQPVVRVTWNDVAQFMNWLSIKDGLQPVYEPQGDSWQAVRPVRNGYRLPTEAEWEWAARYAGKTTPQLYPWGEDLPPADRSGNYADVTAKEILPTTLVTYSDGYAVSAPAASYAANPLGLYDLGGNVAEWMQDVYSVDTLEATDIADDPLGPANGPVHVVRGASWRSATVTDLRLAFRNFSSEAREDLGFRIARNLQ